MRIIIALFAVTVATHSSNARAWCQMTTNQSVQSGEDVCGNGGVPLAWQGRCLSYAIDERGSISLDDSQVIQAIDTSFGTWGEVTCDGIPDVPDGPIDFQLKALEASTCQKAEFNSNGPNVNTVAFLQDWVDSNGDPLDSQAFAITFVWHSPSTGEIFDADMLINENLGPYGICPEEGCAEGNPGVADLRNIVTHEAGHFFGIGHTDIQAATMFPSAERTDTEKRSLANDDILAMCSIYPPGTFSESCSPFPAPMGGLALDCEDGSGTGGSGGNGSGGGRCSAQPHARADIGLAFLGAVCALMWMRRRYLARLRITN